MLVTVWSCFVGTSFWPAFLVCRNVSLLLIPISYIFIWDFPSILSCSFLWEISFFLNICSEANFRMLPLLLLSSGQSLGGLLSGILWPSFLPLWAFSVLCPSYPAVAEIYSTRRSFSSVWSQAPDQSPGEWKVLEFQGALLPRPPPFFRLECRPNGNRRSAGSQGSCAPLVAEPGTAAQAAEVTELTCRHLLAPTWAPLRAPIADVWPLHSRRLLASFFLPPWPWEANGDLAPLAFIWGALALS